ncbi:MAG: TetR family transcriptional regulator [Rhodobacteraceae bacterium]|nr:TetR family transcriptional regulator [Paracoccaceae bacterium]QEW21453.1 transcriptional regulator BetI [Marinibacterium anthonyi]
MTHPKPAHHHGNLRAALIHAGIDLLEDGGPEALTLRKCALRAGVSHAAPAHHFDGLAGLKEAIAGEAFHRFSASMLKAVATGDPSPRGRLKSICRGYLQFGLDHPALLDLIFGVPAPVPQDIDPDAKDETAYGVLRQTCAPFVPQGTPREVIEAQVWSLIHGYTLLFISGRLNCRAPRAVEDGPFDAVMALLDRVGVDPAP